MTSVMKLSRAALPLMIKYTKGPYWIANSPLLESLEVFDLKFQLLGGFLKAELGWEGRYNEITMKHVQWLDPILMAVSTSFFFLCLLRFQFHSNQLKVLVDFSALIILIILDYLLGFPL